MSREKVSAEQIREALERAEDHSLENDPKSRAILRRLLDSRFIEESMKYNARLNCYGDFSGREDPSMFPDEVDKMFTAYRKLVADE